MSPSQHINTPTPPPSISSVDHVPTTSNNHQMAMMNHQFSTLSLPHDTSEIYAHLQDCLSICPSSITAVEVAVYLTDLIFGDLKQITKAIICIRKVLLRFSSPRLNAVIIKSNTPRVTFLNLLDSNIPFLQEETCRCISVLAGTHNLCEFVDAVQVTKRLLFLLSRNNVNTLRFRALLSLTNILVDYPNLVKALVNARVVETVCDLWKSGFSIQALCWVATTLFEQAAFCQVRSLKRLLPLIAEVLLCPESSVNVLRKSLRILTKFSSWKDLKKLRNRIAPRVEELQSPLSNVCCSKVYSLASLLSFMLSEIEEGEQV